MNSEVIIMNNYKFRKILCRLISLISRKIAFKGIRFCIRKFMKLIIGNNHIIIETSIENDIKMALDIHDTIQFDLFFFGQRDTDEIAYLRSNLKEGHVFIDIGANIGYYTLVASKCVGNSGKVIAFEANPNNITMLKKNIQLNNCDNVIINNSAVSDINSKVKLSLPIRTDQSGWATLSKKGEYEKWPKVEVPATSIDYYLKKENINHVDLIKMDIEGAEVKALNGMENILSSDNPVIISEINLDDLQANDTNIEELESILNRHQYHAYSIINNSLEETWISKNDESVRNVVFSK